MSIFNSKNNNSNARISGKPAQSAGGATKNSGSSAKSRGQTKSSPKAKRASTSKNGTTAKRVSSAARKSATTAKHGSSSKSGATAKRAVSAAKHGSSSKSGATAKRAVSAAKHGSSSKSGATANRAVSAAKHGSTSRVGAASRISATTAKHGSSSRTGTTAKRSGHSGNGGPRNRRPMSRRNKIKLILIVIGIILIACVIGGYSYMHPERISDEGYIQPPEYANYLIVNGIDVSYAQGHIENWNKVKASGVDAVIVRAGYRDSKTGELNVDEYFERNVREANDAGLMVGAYFFSQATTKREAKEEADFLIGLVSDYDMMLPLVLDFETIPNGRLAKAIDSGKLTKSKINGITKMFCTEVQSAGYESMVYANLDFLTRLFDGEILNTYTNIWVAQYNDENNFPYNFLMWQCSETSEVPGIKGYVDKDFMYINPEGVTKTKGLRDYDAISLGDCNVEMEDHSNTYVGGAVEPKIAVYHGSSKLKEGRDYLVGYADNTAPGTGYAIVRGIGKYKDQVCISFMIKGLFK